MIKVAEFKLNRINSFAFNALSLVTFILGIVITAFNSTEFLRFTQIKHLTENNNLFLAALVPPIVLLAHEGLHAAAYKMFGAKLSFGVKHFNIYITDTSGNLFTLQQMTVIMLFPLTILTAVFFIASNIFGSLLFFFLLGILINISGSVGDIFILVYILYKGKACRVKDEYNGFSLYK